VTTMAAPTATSPPPTAVGHDRRRRFGNLTVAQLYKADTGASRVIFPAVFAGTLLSAATLPL
jgi:hypothetical protein